MLDIMSILGLVAVYLVIGCAVRAAFIVYCPDMTTNKNEYQENLGEVVLFFFAIFWPFVLGALVSMGLLYALVYTPFKWLNRLSDGMADVLRQHVAKNDESGCKEG